jgi:hypothetical protein
MLPNDKSLVINQEKAKEHPEDPHVVLTSRDWTKEENPPFFVSLAINDLTLHNCMYDNGASSNIMTKRIMERLGLKITRPYHNVFAMDSREIETHGIIIGLQVKLAFHPDITFKMDVFLIDVPDAWGMLMSRKWGATMGGCINMDLSYATIPLPPPSTESIGLLRETERKFHIEDPKKPINEFVYYTHDMGCYEVISDFLDLVREKFKDELPKVCNVWDTMDSFDGLFLEEVPEENNINIALSESKVGSCVIISINLSVIRGITSACQDELDKIFGPSIPDVS